MMVSVRIVVAAFTYENTKGLFCLVSSTLGDGQGCDNTSPCASRFSDDLFCRPSLQTRADAVLNFKFESCSCAW